MSRTLFLTNMSKILFMINGCMGGKQCLTGIQFSFVALPLLPCVWPGMICLIRLFQRGHLWTRVQFPCSKPASGSELFTSKLLTLSSVERNENNRIRTIHQMPHGRRWTAVGAQSGCFAPRGPQLTHWGENESSVAPQQYFLDTLDIMWAMLSDVDHFSEASTLAFSKTSFCSG